MSKVSTESEFLTRDISENRGKIFEKNIYSIIYGNTDKAPINSVLSPPAQKLLPCTDGCSLETADYIINDALSKLKSLDFRLYAIALLLYRNGLRISEVLSISPYSITSAGFITISGSKKSNNRIVDSGELRSWFAQLKNKSAYPFQGYDRFYVYRQFKKAGISFQFEGKNTKKVTHAFRHILARDLQNSGVELSDIGSHIGHKSKTAVNNYVSKNKKSNSK